MVHLSMSIQAIRQLNIHLFDAVRNRYLPYTHCTGAYRVSFVAHKCICPIGGRRIPAPSDSYWYETPRLTGTLARAASGEGAPPARQTRLPIWLARNLLGPVCFAKRAGFADSQRTGGTYFRCPRSALRQASPPGFSGRFIHFKSITAGT